MTNHPRGKATTGILANGILPLF